MIEQKFQELVLTVRKFTNAIRRNDKTKSDKIIFFLQKTIDRYIYLLECDKDSKISENRLIAEMIKFSKSMFVKTNNKDIYNAKIQKNIDFISWVNLHIRINSQKRKYTVAQREIFYANLGYNIGSEQNGTRPVIILQNDIGNEKGNTTVVAPITTHKGKVKWDNDKKKYYVKIVQDGTEKNKYLDFYEIPLRLEGKENKLYGFINIMHIRTIDRKRITSCCQGIATEKCFENVIKSITKNLTQKI